MDPHKEKMHRAREKKKQISTVKTKQSLANSYHRVEVKDFDSQPQFQCAKFQSGNFFHDGHLTKVHNCKEGDGSIWVFISSVSLRSLWAGLSLFLFAFVSLRLFMWIFLFLCVCLLSLLSLSLLVSLFLSRLSHFACPSVSLCLSFSSLHRFTHEMSSCRHTKIRTFTPSCARASKTSSNVTHALWWLQRELLSSSSSFSFSYFFSFFYLPRNRICSHCRRQIILRHCRPAQNNQWENKRET